MSSGCSSTSASNVAAFDETPLRMASRMVGASFLAPSTSAINSSSRPGFRVIRTPTTNVPSGFLTMDTATPLIEASYVGRHRISRPVNRRALEVLPRSSSNVRSMALLELATAYQLLQDAFRFSLTAQDSVCPFWGKEN